MLPLGRRVPVVGLCLALALVGGVVSSPPAVSDPTWEPSDWTGVIAGAPVPGQGLPPAPMPPPLIPLPPGESPSLAYEPQTSCDPSPKPGAERLVQIIKNTYGKDQYVWVPRGCDVGGTSEHKEGRAIDWMVTVRDPRQRADAEAFLNWLLGPDQSGREYGHALKLGVMYIGWHDRIWRGFGIDRGWQELKGCFRKEDAKYDNYCHRNHIHISLTRLGASGIDPTGVFVPDDPSAPPPPEAPLDEPVMPELNSPLVQPGPDRDLFTGIGNAEGYETAPGEPLQPGEMRTIPLTAVPKSATSALVVLTARKAASKTRVRVGLTKYRGSSVAVRVPKRAQSTSVISVPVENRSLQIGATRAPVQVRIDVLGYSIDNGVYPTVGTQPAALYSGRVRAGSVVTVRARGAGAVPKAKKKVSAVLLRVVATGRGKEGRFIVFPEGGADLGTRAATIPARGSATSLLVSDVGRDGRVALMSSVRATVDVDILGYVGR